MHRKLRSALLALLLVSPLASRADEPAILAKARAYVGSESALDGITSIRMQGTYVAAEPGGKTSNPSKVDIIFQKPYQHHLAVTSAPVAASPGVPASPGGVHTIGLDGYDGWETDQFPAGSPPIIRLLNPEQVWILRADVWENLGYYRNIEAEGGSVQDQGPATIDGVACEKIAFIHSPNPPDIRYFRYFDLATGRLVFTETSGGLQIREEGEQVVDGIRFPRKIVTGHKTGSKVLTTLTVETVTVNQVFPASLFRTPIPEVPGETSVPAAQPAPASTGPAPVAPGAPDENPIINPAAPPGSP